MRITAAVAGAVLTGLPSASAWACRCVVSNFEQAFMRAELIVHATAVAVKTLSPSEMAIDLQVSRSWKGTSPAILSIRTRGTCAYEASPGEDYVIFLEHVATKDFETSICMGNRHGAEIPSTIDQLDLICSNINNKH